MEESKVCTKCHFEQEISQFTVNYASPDKRAKVCRSCRKDDYLKKTYGITIEDFNEMFEAQGGKCYICRAYGTKGTGLAVDHDHVTGKIRKLLCYNCNSVVGHCKENPEILAKAAIYIQEHILAES